MLNQNEKNAIEKIKNSYTNKTREITKLEELKNLDKKVKNPVYIFAYVYGTISSLILGTGMCLAMKVIGNMMPLGIVIGLIGIAMTITTYPIFKSILNRRKEKYAQEILEKSDILLNNQ